MLAVTSVKTSASDPLQKYRAPSVDDSEANHWDEAGAADENVFGSGRSAGARITGFSEASMHVQEGKARVTATSAWPQTTILRPGGTHAKPREH